MGHLSATYNSIATLVTRDFYLRWRPQATQQRQILVGRIAVVAVFVLGAVWAPIIGGYKSLFIYLQNISAYLMMPFAFIFFLGVFWKRINTQGVVACMLVSFVLCPVMLYNNQLAPGEQWFQCLNTPLLMPWLHRAMIVTGICVAFLVGVSLLTPPPAAGKLVDTTVQCLWSGPVETSAVRWFRDYRLWLGVVCGGTAALWVWMR